MKTKSKIVNRQSKILKPYAYVICNVPVKNGRQLIMCHRPTYLQMYPKLLTEREIKNGEIFNNQFFKKLIIKNITNVCLLNLVNKLLCVLR